MSRGSRESRPFPAGCFRTLGCAVLSECDTIAVTNICVQTKEKASAIQALFIHLKVSSIKLHHLDLGLPNMSTSARRRLMRDFKVSFKGH